MVQRGIRVVALLHQKPDELPAKNSESDPDLRKRLQEFRDKVSKNRLIAFWKSADELPGHVALGMLNAMKSYPAVGWIRANQASSAEILNEINELRKRNSELEQQIQSHTPLVSNIAKLHETFLVVGVYAERNVRKEWSLEITWVEIFGFLSVHLLEYPHDDNVKELLTNFFFSKVNKFGISTGLNDDCYQTIKVQLLALELVDIEYQQTIAAGMKLFWSLTDLGKQVMLSVRSVKTKLKDT